MTAAGGDRGDNTARGTCFHQAHGIFGAPLICALPAEHLGAHRSDDGAQWTRVPAADRQTDEERCGDVSPRDGVTCDERPGHHGDHSNLHGHPPTLYRWPAARPAVADAVMAGPGAAITEGVTEVGLREAESRLYAWLSDRTSRPDGSEWDHGALRVAVRDLLAVVREVAP